MQTLTVNITFEKFWENSNRIITATVDLRWKLIKGFPFFDLQSSKIHTVYPALSGDDWREFEIEVRQALGEAIKKKDILDLSCEYNIKLTRLYGGIVRDRCREKERGQ